MLEAKSGIVRSDLMLIYLETGFCQWLHGVCWIRHAAVGMATDAKLVVDNCVEVILAG